MHSPLLSQFRPELLEFSRTGKPVLDLACGDGRNGLYLLSLGIPVVFADIRQEALMSIQESIESQPDLYNANQASYWNIDFETGNENPLPKRAFSSVLVFRYLHRPLMRPIIESLCDNGLVIYETFTVDQANLGRPKNPNFLLNHGELSKTFKAFTVLYEFEGENFSETSGNRQAISQVVARRTTD